jgi:8-oxo-dGTP pyrophosphatase MutT (NUDIX family)
LSIIANIIYKSNKLLNKIVTPTTIGVRVILVRDEEVLLVKHTYLDGWYMPGGRVNKGETLEQAIRRELKEELGADLETISLHGIYNNFSEYKNDNVVIFICRDFTLTGSTDREIEKYDFFRFDELPEKVSPATRRRILEYVEGKSGNFGMW